MVKSKYTGETAKSLFFLHITLERVKYTGIEKLPVGFGDFSGLSAGRIPYCLRDTR